MAQQTIREHITRIKAVLKLNNADARLTDRNIYLLMKKHSKFLMKRDSSWLRVSNSIYQTLPFVELEEVDAVLACNIQTDCKIRRTKEKLPALVENSDGPIIRRVTSLDGGVIFTPIEASAFQRKIKKSTFKFDKTLYYWYSAGYLYFPNIGWDAVRVEGYFEEVLPPQDCEPDSTACDYKQDSLFVIPDFLVSAMDELIMKELSLYLSIPQDHFINKNENIKQ